MISYKYFLCGLILFTIYNTNAQTPRISFEAPYAYPEGVAYHDGSKRFFVSSVKTGVIGTVDEKGTYKVFYEDTSLKSSYGMEADAKRNKLWVCTGDATYSKFSNPATYKKMIRLIGLDLATGKKTDDVDLSGLMEGKHFANDLTLDNNGNIYITDSYSPVIYKVDIQMKGSVFSRNDFFKTEHVGLNGIEWHPGGFLIVAQNSSGQLFKVDLMQPEQVTRIKIKTFFPGADGLLWDKSGNLVLIQNKGVHKVFQLASNDNWQSADVIASTLAIDRFHQPTTGVMQGEKIYVLNSKMNELTDPTAKPSTEFSLQLVRFVPVK